MVKNEIKSLEALHFAIIHIKMMVSRGNTLNEIYHYVDEIEYLPQLMLANEDKTLLFEEHLEKISKNFNVINLVSKYKSKG